MSRFLPAFRFSVLMLTCLTGNVGRAETTASGFGPEVSPAERALAADAEPDGYFREMTGMWHGVPGLEALRARWERFAAAEPEFAVLAALISESEGKPEEALEKLQGLPGHSARWNEGRILAILGREAEAVAVLSALTTAAERPEMGAAALIALTERDCIRGDFAEALRRTTAAWKARTDEGFRLRILERHLSLLVEAGKEREFVDEQVAAAESADGANADTAGKVMAVMADWFTADDRLRTAREKWGATFSILSIPGLGGRMPGGPMGRLTMQCGILRPRGAALEALGQDASAPLETAGSLAYHLAQGRKWPETLDGWPLLKRAFAAHPLNLSQSLFSNPDPGRPLPPLARHLADSLEPGMARRMLDLMDRAWDGRATREDAETLATLIVEAPELRRQRSVAPPIKRSLRARGWPVRLDFPAEEVIWNFSGESWTAFYRSSCQLAPLITMGANIGFLPQEARLAAWSQWRPQWPAAEDSALTTWAWSQLTLMQEATPARAAAIAGRMADPGDRFLFAARCGLKNLLAEWCLDRDLLRRVHSTALMGARRALEHNPTQAPPNSAGEGAVLNIAREMARRMDLNALDLIRTLPDPSRQVQPWMKRDMQGRPVDPVLAETLGGFSSDAAVNAHWTSHLLKTLPHPLEGVPVSPSVERFRVLSSVLSNQRATVAGLDSQLQKVVQGMFGGADGFNGGMRPFDDSAPPPELLRAIAAFPTAHPIKRQLDRWDTLLRASRTGDGRPEAGGWDREARKEQEAALTTALRALADEEQSQLSWHLVRAMLEENTANRALLLGLVQARSPLAAGVTGTPPPPPPPPPLPIVVPVPGQPTPKGLTAIFVKMIADPAARQQLEPAGALVDFMRKRGNDAFFQSLRRCAPSKFAETAEHLLDVVDPLAARMAVILMAEPDTSLRNRPGETAPMLLRALALFPDDPELLLAYAARHSGTETGRAAFRRGLASLKTMISFQETTKTAWCGIDGEGVAGDAETARALAAFAERSQPATLPQSWVRAMESVLHDQPELDRLTPAEVRSTALAVVRWKAPWRSGQGSPPEWMPLLARLSETGRRDAAAAAAEALLSQPTGSLGYPGDPTEPAAPWRNSSGLAVTAPEAEGWRWLELAGKDDPTGLAERLRAVAAAHPADEHTALAALLATGRTRTLTAEDVKMPGLSAAGRHRALAYASWLLPPDRLPEALVLESWEAEARVEFSDVSNGDRNFLQGNDYLDRLEKAGATEAARRVLPGFAAALEKIAAGGFDETFPFSIIQRLQRLGTPAQIDDFRALLADHLKKLPEGPRSYDWLATAFEAHMQESGAADPPAELARRVTLALKTETAADSRTGTDSEDHLGRIAITAAADPRWHTLLRPFLASRQALSGKRSPASALTALTQYFDALDSGDLLPDLALDFKSSAPGKGILRWTTRGPLLPERPGMEYGPISIPPGLPGSWAKLAAGLAGKCNAVVMVEDPGSGATRIVSRLERLAADGEVSLENLPQIGRLRVRLEQRDAPQSTAEVPPLGYNSLPVLIDTSKPPGADTVSPEDWQLLADPVPLGATTQWYIESPVRDSKPWPKGMHLVLLDDASQICASTSVSEEVRAITVETAGFPGVQLGMNRLTPRAAYSKAEPRLQRIGPPRQLALALSLSQRRGMGAENRPAASLSLRAWPPPAAPSTQNRLETLGFWQLSQGGEDRTYPPAIADDTSLAAWFTPGKLFLHDLLGQDPPREIALGLPRQTRLDTLFWESGRLVMGYVLPYANGSKECYGFANVRPGDPVPVTFGELPRGFRLHPFDGSGIGIAPIFLDSQGSIHGVLDPAGKFLPLPPAESGTPPREPLGSYQQLSATTHLCRQEKNGLYPILDWTDGTLRITSVAKPPTPQIKRRPQWHSDGEGTTGEWSENLTKRWRHPFSLNDFRLISENLVVGIGIDGNLVLFRPIPAPPPPSLPRDAK